MCCGSKYSNGLERLDGLDPMRKKYFESAQLELVIQFSAAGGVARIFSVTVTYRYVYALIGYNIACDTRIVTSKFFNCEKYE
jgi:hypothetical protein